MFKIIFAFGVIVAISSFVILALLAGVLKTALSRRGETEEIYRRALEAYRRQPHNPALRQAALQAGRLYSHSTRNGYGNAFFDESALRNDLDSVEAAVATVASVAPATQTIADRLVTLDGLWNQGLITEDEYRERRSAILNEV